MKIEVEEAINQLQDAKDGYKEYLTDEVLDMAIKALKQEQKTGHWIVHEEQFNVLGIAIKGGVKCSECGYTTHNKLHMEIGCPYKYCPDCGIRMAELQENEG